MPKSDLNRVLIAFNADYDHCKGIDHFSGVTAKAAADKACKEAFKALDRLKLNDCQGWQQPACRLLSKQDLNFQCSCKIADCNELSVTGHKVTSFRECAPVLRAQEERTGVTLAPTIDFQQLRKTLDNILDTARALRASSYTALLAGSCGGLLPPNGAGSSDLFPYNGAVSLIDIIDSFDDVYSTYVQGSSSGVFAQEATGYSSTQNLPHVPETQSLMTDQDQPEPTLPYSCPLCSEKFHTLASLGEHMKMHPIQKRKSRGDPVIQEVETGRFLCRECGKSYREKRVLRAHERTHTTMNTYCIFCDRTLGSLQSYKDHMRRKHPEISAAEIAAEKAWREAEKTEKCDECGKGYKTVQGLRHHKSMHDGETTCDICGAILNSKAALLGHKKSIHKQ